MNKNSKINFTDKLIIFLVLFFIVGYIVYPLISLIRESLTGNENFLEFSSYFQLLNKVSLEASLNSVLLSLITIVFCAIISIYFAYIFQFHNFYFKSFFTAIFLIPLATPPIIGVTSFLFLLSENGLLTKILSTSFGASERIFSFDGWIAIIVIHVYSFYSLYFLFVSSALKKLDVNLIEASSSLGASKWRTFRKVILPLLTPSIISASLLTFMASMASFSAPFIFGGSNRFLTTEIYYAKINGDNSYAASLSILLTIISVTFLFLARWYRGKKVFDMKTKGTQRKVSIDSGKINWVSFIIIIVFAVIIILPIISLSYLSLMPEGTLMNSKLEITPTLNNYIKLFTENNFSEPILNSFKMAIVAVIITSIIGIISSFYISRKRIKGNTVIESLISLPYGIPGTVIALCLIVSFNTPNLFSLFNVLVGTFWIIPLAYSIRNLPILTQSTISGFQSIDMSLEEAAYSLGSGAFYTFKRILFPLLYPSILNGILLVFINSLGEFVSTILLYSYSTKTISIEIYSQLRMYNNGLAAAFGMILFLFVIGIVYFSRKSIARSF